jgi:tetratricopeptide (TPR) repeat protein
MIRNILNFRFSARRTWECLILRIGCLAAAIWILLMCGIAHAQEPPGRSARLYGFRHEFQTWCNCGPANLMMALSYYGWPYDQAYTARWLKPSVEDKNVSPWELVDYVNRQEHLPHLRALWRYGGDVQMLKLLITAGFPVVVESGFSPDGQEWMGHYKTVVGYDDDEQAVWTYDSYLGAPLPVNYVEFDRDWRHFNRVFVVIYPHDNKEAVLALLGPLANSTAAAERALETAQAAVTTDPRDVWAWFNAGTSAVLAGQYSQAAASFDEAFRLGLPPRMLWYQFGPYEAYYHVGRFCDVLTLADETSAVTPYVEETRYWRGMAYASLGRLNDALNEFEAVLNFNPYYTAAQVAKEQILSGAYQAVSHDRGQHACAVDSREG